MLNLLVADPSAMTIRSKDHPLVPSSIWGLRMSLTYGAHQVAHRSDGENIQDYRDHDVHYKVAGIGSFFWPRHLGSKQPLRGGCGEGHWSLQWGHQRFPVKGKAGGHAALGLTVGSAGWRMEDPHLFSSGSIGMGGRKCVS